MAQLEINLPPDVEMKVAQLVDQGEFETQEQAVEELLSIGVRAYQTGEDSKEDEPIGDGIRGHDDEYVF